jgi:hypothetical protein
MMSVMELNANNPDIKRRILHMLIFWQLTCQFLSMRPTPLRQIAGSTPQSPSLGYSIVQSIRRLCTQHSNSEAQLEPGGLPISPPYRQITMFHGASFVLLFVHITYLRVCSMPS